jgi:hypothetical protein
LNEKLLAKLEASGIPIKRVVYVQVHDAGSSSGVILNLLRDAALLQNRGAKFLDSKDVRGLSELTNALDEGGAIVYVDDFSGSGAQFCESRDFVAPYVIGTFSEFLLLPCICEEAQERISETPVECVFARVHKKADRPLLPESNLLPEADREQLCILSHKIQPVYDLGFRNMGTMVVFYSNCPDSTPLLLRGNPGQRPFKGILPRTTDLQ